MTAHNVLTDPYLHEPKGFSSASADQVYVSDGAGSGSMKYLIGTGWGNYRNNAGSQNITTTAAKVINDGAGSTTNTDYLPLPIRGTGDLWDTSTNLITPIAVGDAYDLRLDFTLGSTTGSPNQIKIELDIGGGVSPSVVIVTKWMDISNSPQSTSVNFFTLNTFVSNGGALFLSTDTGTVDIDEFGLHITRTHYEVS